MRDFFIAVFTPVARRLGFVEPTTLTLVSLFTGLLAGAAFALAGARPGLYLVGGALAAISGAGDSLDGIVARMYGRVTRVGEFLDHFGDRVVETAIFTGIALASRTGSTFPLLVTLVVLMHGYLSTQIEATFGKRYYGGAGRGELFSGLVVFSVVMTFYSDAQARLGGKEVSLTDLFFAIVGIVTVTSFVYRLHYALRCAREEAGSGA